MAAIPSLGTLKLAEFKTAYLQRAIPLDVVVADSGLKVGALVKLDLSGSIPVIGRATGLTDATHLIAQSDMTLIPEDHPKTDYRDYRYSDVVKSSDDLVDNYDVFADANFCGVYATATALAAAGDGTSGQLAYVVADNKIYKSSGSGWTADTTIGTSGVVDTTKHVSLYPLVDKTDVVVRA